MAFVMPGPRPRLRGVSHRIAFRVVLVAGGILVAAASDQRARIAAAIYVISLAGMFGVSATLHGRDWNARGFAWLRRADHAMIFACIAGTYTPFCVVAMEPPSGTRLLALAWGAAALGWCRALLWPHAPRWITSALFVLVGWVVVAEGGAVRAALDPLTFWLLVGGGVWCTVGALIYLFKRPDPWPAVFGYHEVFHLLIIVGTICHFVAVARVVTRCG